MVDRVSPVSGKESSLAVFLTTPSRSVTACCTNAPVPGFHHRSIFDAAHFITSYFILSSHLTGRRDEGGLFIVRACPARHAQAAYRNLAPLSSPMNADGALSSPSVTNSLCLSLPSRSHCGMSRIKSGYIAAKSRTMKPRKSRPLDQNGAHDGVGPWRSGRILAEDGVVVGMRLHTRMLKSFRRGSTASNTLPPTFSK